jgi:putative ABC transport system permease protein
VLDLDTVRVIEGAPGIARDGAQPVASAEFVIIVNDIAQSGREMNIALRGVDRSAFAIRDEVHIVKGRRFEPGRREVIVAVPWPARSAT